MRRTPFILLGTALIWAAGVAWCLSGCAPIYAVYDEQAPDNPIRLQEAEAQARATDFRNRLAEANAACEAGQIDRALAVLRDLLVVDPTYAPAYRALGEIHMNRGDWFSAERALARAARLGPGDFDIHHDHGVALQMQGRFGEAVKAFHRALAARPDSPQASLSLAVTYLQINETPSALFFAEKAVELDPGNGPARANLGAVYERLGRYGEAIGQYEVALEYMDPTQPLLVNLINAQLEGGRHGDAAATAERLVRIAPSPDAYERLGWCYFQEGRHEQSVDAYRKALEMEPNHWRALNGIGTNAFYRWQLSEKRDALAAREARDAFRKSLRLNPNQPEIIRLMLRHQL